MLPPFCCCGCRTLQVHKVNEAAGATIAGYTFDAGPNAVLFTTRAQAALLLAAVLVHFPPVPEAVAASSAAFGR
jgi:mevalonate pyrophosphate decarboxylase